MLYPVLRVLYKGTHFTVHILLGFAISCFAPICFGSQWHQLRKGKNVCQWWSLRATTILGLKIRQFGYPQQTTTLFTANHISFLDIIVLAAVTPVKFLAKETLRYWPVIGFISSSIGTVFIKRGNRRVMHHTLQIISQSLQQENSLVIFPEGTTTIGNSVNKFNTGLFQAAINTSKPVQPVALRYLRNGSPDRTAAYIDNDNFIVSLIKIMAQARVDVELVYCDVLESNVYTRAELALVSHSRISEIVCSH